MIIVLFSMNKSQISNNLGHKIKVEKCQFLFENMKIRNNTDISTCIKVCGQNMTTDQATHHILAHVGLNKNVPSLAFELTIC